MDKISTSLHSPTINRLLAILEPLLISTSGAAAFQHTTLLLENIRAGSEETQHAYADLLRELADILVSHTPADSPLQAHLQLLCQHLCNPLNAVELKQLRETIRNVANQNINISTKPALSEQADHSTDPLAADFMQQSSAQSTPADATLQPGENTATPDATTAATTTDTIAIDKSSQRVDQVYRRHLDDKRQRIQAIQNTLGEQVNAVIKQSEEFGVLLEVEYASLQQSESITDVQDLRKILLTEVGKLLKGNLSLATKLDKAKNYLKIIESEGQHLNDELARVHILSLTDDLTGLSNRRAFMRRLEDETSRVQRYGSPLSLALIDMDFFKRINDQFGHPVGDEVLRTFSNNILSIFRHHDMVARYGGEEFAILLPNTDIEGAYRALEKVKARTATSHFQNHGDTLPMPTFSAGIALYRPGETPGDLIERADKALFRAKDLGRNRIELAPSDALDKPSESGVLA